MKSSFLLALLLAGVCSQAAAQSKPVRSVPRATGEEHLTNRSIIALTAAGLSADLITAKIATSSCVFDTSTNGLLALKQAKVDDTVIKAMLERGGSKGNKTAASTAKAANGKLPKLEMANYPYLRNSSTGAWSPLEKTLASFKAKPIAMGYGGIKFQYTLDGEKSTARFAPGDSVLFLLNTFGTALPEFTLYQAKREKGKRVALGAKVKAMGTSAEEGGDVLTFNVLPAGNGVFRLVPGKKLPAGEYLFVGKPGANTITMDAYAFGID